MWERARICYIAHLFRRGVYAMQYHPGEMDAGPRFRVIRSEAAYRAPGEIN